MLLRQHFFYELNQVIIKLSRPVVKAGKNIKGNDLMIECGLKGKAETLVTREKTAKFVGSGELEVLATPMLAALMENAALGALNLSENQTSVGTYLNIKHLAPTPVGMKVWAEAEVIKTEGRKIIFKVVAFDEEEKIGEGEHERVIVSKDKFMAKAKNKKVVDKK